MNGNGGTGGAQSAYRTFIVFAIVLAIVHQGRDFLVPLAIALLLFVLIEAIRSRTGRLSFGGWRIPGWLAGLLSAAIVIGGVFGIVTVISSEIEQIAAAAPEFSQRLQQRIADLAPLIGQSSSQQLQAKIDGFDPRELLSSLEAPIAWLLTSGILIFFYTLFLLLENQAFARKLPWVVGSPGRAATVAATFRSAARVVEKYMWITTIVSLVAALLTYAILALTGTEFAAALAVLVFFTAFIPTIGTIFGIVVPAGIALLQFGLTLSFWIVLLGLFVMRMLTDNALQPAMAGKGLNLSPLMVMLALAFWGGMWGLVGAFLSTPLMVVAMIVFAQIPTLRPLAAIMSSDGRVSGEPPPAT